MIDGISLLIGGYGIYGNILTCVLPPHLAGGGHWQFLTNLSLIYSMVVFGLGFIAHLTKNQRLFAVKNTIHPIGIALESIVALIYWPLRIWFIHLLANDPSLMTIPLSIDLSIHLMPLVSLLIDYLVFMPKWTIRTSTALMICTAFTICYWVLLKYLIDVENGGVYPYAFLNVDTELQRGIVFCMVGLSTFCQFLSLRKLYETIVGVTEDVSAEIDHKLAKKTN
jgi:hypothetical protein